MLRVAFPSVLLTVSVGPTDTVGDALGVEVLVPLFTEVGVTVVKGDLEGSSVGLGDKEGDRVEVMEGVVEGEREGEGVPLAHPDSVRVGVDCGLPLPPTLPLPQGEGLMEELRVGALDRDGVRLVEKVEDWGLETVPTPLPVTDTVPLNTPVVGSCVGDTVGDRLVVVAAEVA